MSENRHLVVIGGVAAGPKLAAKARREDPDLPITMITDEEHISYAACGTPYYLGGVVPKPEDLLVRRPEEFAQANRVDVKALHRATRIDRIARTVEILDMTTGETSALPYSHLGIATGAAPFIPPVPGKDAEGVFALRSVTDAFRIGDYIVNRKPAHAVVVGAGLIGLEVVENLLLRGVPTTVVELAPQVLSQLDPEIAAPVENELRRLGADVLLGEKVQSIATDTSGQVTAVVTDSRTIPAELVLLSIGVRPNVDLASEAGLDIGVTGAIKVNSRMQTSDPHIYAVGDCAETVNRVTGQPVWVPLGSTANKQARCAAINITGGDDYFPGVTCTLITKVGHVTVSRVGLNARDAEKNGIDHTTVIVPGTDRPGYYPGAAPIMVKLLVDSYSRRLIGGQAVGTGVVDKRIDVLATAIAGHMTVDDLASLDLAYAPPFSGAMDVVITAANVMRNKLDADLRSYSPGEFEKRRAGDDGFTLVDVREDDEWSSGHLPDALHIPLAQVADRAKELPDAGEIITYCKGGLRSANACRRLIHAGLSRERVAFLEGGVTAYPEKLVRT